MQPQTIEKRVDRLEVRMTAVEQLPARVDKLTERVDGLNGRVDGLNKSVDALRGEMKELGDRLDRKIDESAILVYNVVTRDLGRKIDDKFDEANRKIDDKFDEARRHALVLHEDLVERIERIGEGRGRRTKK